MALISSMLAKMTNRNASFVQTAISLMLFAGHTSSQVSEEHACICMSMVCLHSRILHYYNYIDIIQILNDTIIVCIGIINTSATIIMQMTIHFTAFMHSCMQNVNIDLQTLVQFNPLKLTVYPSTLRSMEEKLKDLCVQDTMDFKENLDKQLEEEMIQVYGI